MPVVELEYSGRDLIISKDIVEKTLGLHPGDRIEIRPKISFLSAKHPSSETTAEIVKTLEELRDAFDPAVLADWEVRKREIWAS